MPSRSHASSIRFASIAGTRLFAASLIAIASATVHSEEFPSRIMQIVVPAPAGGSADYYARVLGPKISESIKQTVLIENKPGASGVIGARTVISSPPDGHTLLLNSIAAIAVGPNLSKPRAFDPIQDLTPISTVASVPAILVVRPGLGFRTLDDLVKYAKANPGKINAASSGTGTLSSLNVALLQRQLGIKLTHVPYRGAPPAINDLLGGHVDLMFSDVPFFLTHVKAEKIVALAAAASDRIPVLPDLKTVKELGYPNLIAANVYSLFAPPKMPAALAAKLNQIIRNAVADQEVKNTFLAQSAIAEAMPLAEFDALFKSEERRLMALFDDLGPASK